MRMKLFKNKGGFTDNLQNVMFGLFGVIALFVVLGILLAQGTNVTASIRDSSGASTTSQYKSANYTIEGMNQFSTNMPSIGNIIGVALIITVLLGALVFAIIRR